ncbi:MAG: carboxypeptidase-like regulatory domain-containing protein [Bryobacteraceae bacterium]
MITITSRPGARALRLNVAAVVCLILSVGTTILHAQTTLGDLNGTVSDSTGAAIPGVNVNVVNEDTQAKRTAVTDAVGVYRVDGLLVGSYRLEVEATGFNKYVQGAISIIPAVLKRVDVTLQVGSIAETVEVTGAASVVETESPALTTGIPKIAYSELPLMNESRAGYTFDPLTWVAGSSSGNAIYSFAGNRPSMQQANLDGMQHDIYFMRPPTSAISEVSVVMSNAPAEYARPVTMDAVFKSGTNRLGGEFMADFVNPCTDARSDPFNNPSHPPCKTQWRLFESIGGPVYIPKVYDGRNKSFFFFTFNKNPAQRLSGIPRIESVPTVAMQGGDFSKYPKTILDPTTGLPFPGNIVPGDRIAQFAKGVIQDYYGSQFNYVGAADSFINNGAQTGRDNADGKRYAMRFDHNLGNADIFSASYSFQKDAYAQDDVLHAPMGSGETPLNSQTGLDLTGRTFSLSETHTFSPRVLNQARVGVTRTIFSMYRAANSLQSGSKLMGADFIKNWGLQGIAAPNLSGAPQFLINNWNYSYNNNETYTYDTRYQFYDNVSFHIGKHTFKTGYSAIKLLEDGTVSGPYFGNFTFSGQFTGESWADFLLGLPSQFQRYTVRPIVAKRRWEHGAFFQDDFRVTPNLTIYYGLRWSRFTVPYDKNGLYYNFDPATFSVVVPNDFARQQASAAWPNQTFPIKTASEVGYPTKLINSHNNWNPRLGFAYKLWKNSVLRGGYGVYTGVLRFNELQTTGPFAITENFINSTDSTAPGGARYSMPNPFPATAATAEVATISGFSKDYHTPYSQNWNFTLEHELFRNWGVRGTYRGVKSTQLTWIRDLNEVPVSSEPFDQSRRPYPGLQNINFVENGANDWYHATMFEVTHPWTKGFYFTAAYTRSWSRTEAPGGPYEEDQTASPVEYSYNRARDGGRSAAFPTHDFILNFVDQLPFGRGKHFGREMHPVLNAFIGNWQMTGSFSWRSGWFFTPMLDGVDPGNIGKTSDRRPNLVSGCDVYANQSLHGQWFNPACFVEPAAGQLGNVQVNSLEGPSAWVFNLNPFKEFPLKFREGAKLRVGANIYNFLNHPTYAIPINTINSPAAGMITRTEYARGWSHDYAGQRQFVFDARVVF